MSAMRFGPDASTPQHAVRRIRWLFVLVACAIGVFWVRAFYLQIIQHDYYVQAAKSDQLKEYEIPAARGLIQAYSGDDIVAIVLNQELHTIYADPTLIKDADRVAVTLAEQLGGEVDDYKSKITQKDTRYIVLGKKVDAKIRQAILRHKYPGIGAQAMSYRTYPNGQLASQLLGFVNDEGKGVYGIEQALNKGLSGTPGQLKAVTDINGVPLAANLDNIRVAPKTGDGVVLTIDVAMQKQLEGILRKGLQHAQSKQGSALIMDPNTGAIKAMANWPTFDPGKYAEVEDPSVFSNGAVTKALEVGSTMKPLTAAAALDMRAISVGMTYFDPASWTIEGHKITNVEEDGGPGRHSLAELLNLSLNTGATWLLMQMSMPGGTEITQAGRQKWHDYLTDHYRFGQETEIEQGYESPGIVPETDINAPNLTYATTTFGQSMTATPLQMAAAYSSILNGGIYYRPHLIDRIISADGTTRTIVPKVLKENVVSADVSEQMQPLLEYVVEHHSIGSRFDQSKYSVGGKTGTAQVAAPNGGYKPNDFNGTYVGFVGGDRPEYVIAVVAYEPQIGGYAGSVAAQPIFANLAQMLIEDFSVSPRSR